MELSKNNLSLYGKCVTSEEVNYKEHCLDSLYPPVIRHIPVGSAFTSYARQFMKRAAQANAFYGTFLYCDTDGIHCN